MKYISSALCEQETIINIDYEKQIISIYSSRKEAIAVITKVIGKPTEKHAKNKSYWTGATWNIPFYDREKIDKVLNISAFVDKEIEIKEPKKEVKKVTKSKTKKEEPKKEVKKVTKTKAKKEEPKKEVKKVTKSKAKKEEPKKEVKKVSKAKTKKEEPKKEVKKVTKSKAKKEETKKKGKKKTETKKSTDETQLSFFG